LRAPGSRVLYFAGYKTIADRYRFADIERAADQVVWCCDEPPGFARTFGHDCGMAYFTAPPVKLATKRSTKKL
jgi:hypothetical protein